MAGGLLDQTQWFLDAFDFVDSERASYESPDPLAEILLRSLDADA